LVIGHCMINIDVKITFLLSYCEVVLNVS